jgi:hypothetical protein
MKNTKERNLENRIFHWVIPIYRYYFNMLQHCLWLAKQETCQYVV